MVYVHIFTYCQRSARYIDLGCNPRRPQSSPIASTVTPLNFIRLRIGHTTRRIVNFSEHRKYMNDMLKEELGAFLYRVPGFNSLEKDLRRQGRCLDLADWMSQGDERRHAGRGMQYLGWSGDQCSPQAVQPRPRPQSLAWSGRPGRPGIGTFRIRKKGRWG
jgi:hypothetical protein